MRSSGIFFVVLSVGFLIVLTSAVFAQGSALSANFTANTTSGVVPLMVQFTDTSTGNVTGWDWNFGDSTDNATVQNPFHIYNSTGQYPGHSHSEQ